MGVELVRRALPVLPPSIRVVAEGLWRGGGVLRTRFATTAG